MPAAKGTPPAKTTPTPEKKGTWGGKRENTGGKRTGAGRPSSFSWEIAKEICVRIADGEMLTSICSDVHMPSRSTVNQWLLFDGDPQHDEFKKVYGRAKEIQADTLFDETLDIADDTARDWKMVGKNKDVPTPDSEVVNRSKLRAEVRFKIAGYLNPMKYKTLDNKSNEPVDDGTTRVTITGGLPDA